MKVFLILVSMVLMIALPTQAQDSIRYSGQPDEVAIFLNNVAFVQDNLTLPAGVDVELVIPYEAYPGTIVLRENGRRMPTYRTQIIGNELVIRWQSDGSGAESRDVSVSYLINGLSWTPSYEMWLGDTTEQVGFDFFAEITNQIFSLDEANVRLVAGRVDTNQQIGDISRITSNQYVAGYESGEAVDLNGEVTIQYIYELGKLSSEPLDTLYQQLYSGSLPARRILLWNASVDDEPIVIYKVRNTTEIPFTEGIVHSYEDGIFVGSDFIEMTPTTSEGSVTVGTVQGVRVNQVTTQTAVPAIGYRDTRFDVTLTLENFTGELITLEVISYYPADGVNFVFSHEPVRQEGNVFRWEVTLEPGGSEEITYSYTAD